MVRQKHLQTHHPRPAHLPRPRTPSRKDSKKRSSSTRKTRLRTTPTPRDSWQAKLLLPLTHQFHAPREVSRQKTPSTGPHFRRQRADTHGTTMPRQLQLTQNLLDRAATVWNVVYGMDHGRPAARATRGVARRRHVPPVEGRPQGRRRRAAARARAVHAGSRRINMGLS